MSKRADALSLSDKIRIGTADFTIETIHLCRDGKVQLTVVYLSMPYDFMTVNCESWQEIEVIEK